MRDLSSLIDEAAEVDSRGFLHLVDRVGQLLSTETGRAGELRITGRLITVPPSGTVTVIGDIHGDFESLKHILKEDGFLEKASSGKEVYAVFLGDYGDRGPAPSEVYYVVLSLKDMFPEKVLLLQGNHEGPEDLMAHPHDLPYHLHARFSGEWRTVYGELSRLFRSFYTAVLVDGRCVMLHGGVPSGAEDLEDVAYAYDKHPAENHLEEILWSDPSDGIVGTSLSPRGAGRLFGEDVTRAFLKMLGAHFMIRGHEPARMGYKINHGGRVLTLFSRKGSPYHNRYGAYLSFDLSSNVDSVSQLESSIRRF